MGWFCNNSRKLLNSTSLPLAEAFINDAWDSSSFRAVCLTIKYCNGADVTSAKPSVSHMDWKHREKRRSSIASTLAITSSKGPCCDQPMGSIPGWYTILLANSSAADTGAGAFGTVGASEVLGGGRGGGGGGAAAAAGAPQRKMSGNRIEQKTSAASSHNSTVPISGYNCRGRAPDLVPDFDMVRLVGSLCTCSFRLKREGKGGTAASEAVLKEQISQPIDAGSTS
mmetsp:Transcript_36753/g.78037  ORF Transcript_36753/g.78037 Transcript_36753/m.78037 type:complete len:226 (-) Transcript_36753:17-694(-)